MIFSDIRVCSYLFLPLISFIILIFFGKKINKKSHFVALPLIGLTLLNSFSFLVQTFFTHSLHLQNSIEWFNTGSFAVSLGYIIDNVSIIMLCVVSLISFLVHLYSSEYMKGDPRYSRYYAFLGIFTFSMNGIVLSDSLIMMYIFWELVGLSSFLLIGFWFEKDRPPLAANKAFLTNRVGDIGMFIGIMILFFSVGTFNIHDLVYGINSNSIDMNLLTIAGILVFMGAVGKSAQFPLHIWLPDAMEGPTPVSALIHAATMVAAGVYMTYRIFPFLTPNALMFIAIIGAITSVMAAITAITRNDIKAVLAYSTISQLGYMIMAIGVGAHVYAFFHLVTHAMFKACLFLCSGSVIHGMHHALHNLNDHQTDPQDMNNMGGLKDKMKITYYTMLVSTLAIAGVPFFSGFLSKDGILAGTLAYYHEYHGWTIILPLAGFGVALITAFYMFRLIFKTFHGKPNNKEIFKHIHKSPLPMTLPLILLSILSLGFVFTFDINPLHADGWFKHLVGYGQHIFLDMDLIKDNIHHAHNQAMSLSLVVAGIGILLSVIFYYLKAVDVDKVASFFNIIGLYSLSSNKFYIDKIYTMIIYNPFMKFSKLSSIIDWNIYDQKFIDSWGWITLKISNLSGQADYNILDQKIVDGVSKLTNFLSRKLRKTQSGVLQNYLLAGFGCLVIIILLIQQIR